MNKKFPMFNLSNPSRFSTKKKKMTALKNPASSTHPLKALKTQKSPNFTPRRIVKRAKHKFRENAKSVAQVRNSKTKVKEKSKRNLVLMVVSIARNRGSDGSTSGADTGRSSFNTGRNELQRIREKSVGRLVISGGGGVVVGGGADLSVALHNKKERKGGRLDYPEVSGEMEEGEGGSGISIRGRRRRRGRRGSRGESGRVAYRGCGGGGGGCGGGCRFGRV